MPYIGNEEWIGLLEAKGILAEKQAWRPWYTEKGGGGKPPAGYATAYDVKGAPDKDFSFVTIRLAGHMVPSRFFAGPCLAACLRSHLHLLACTSTWSHRCVRPPVCAFMPPSCRVPSCLPLQPSSQRLRLHSFRDFSSVSHSKQPEGFLCVRVCRLSPACAAFSHLLVLIRSS